ARRQEGRRGDLLLLALAQHARGLARWARGDLRGRLPLEAALRLGRGRAVPRRLALGAQARRDPDQAGRLGWSTGWRGASGAGVGAGTAARRVGRRGVLLLDRGGRRRARGRRGRWGRRGRGLPRAAQDRNHRLAGRGGLGSGAWAWGG